jgi:hypothetical protein
MQKIKVAFIFPAPTPGMSIVTDNRYEVLPRHGNYAFPLGS